MLFRHPSTLAGFRFFVGHAVSPAIFHDLANIHATLASYFWLGFVTTGLSPDKKRLAWLGAQRLKCGTAGKERPERSELAALPAIATTGLFCHCS